MSTVDSLRAQFAKEEQERRLANNAALKGAVRAFPKPQSPSIRSPTSSTPKSPPASASAAATKIWHTNTGNNPPRPPIKPSKFSSASLGAVRAHQKSQENLSIRHDVTSSPRPESPQNAAAVFAAAHYKPKTVRPPTSSLRSQTQLRPLSLEPEKEETDVDKLPDPGTVRDVKKWLQSLEHSSSADASEGRETQSSLNDTALPTQKDKSDLDFLPKSRPEPTKSPKLISSKPPTILSPRPIRATSAASSIEAASRRQASVDTVRGPSLDQKSNEKLGIKPRPSIRARPIVPPKRDGRSISVSVADDDEEERPALPARKPTLPNNTTAPPPQIEPPVTHVPAKPQAPPPRRSRPPAAINQPDLDDVEQRPSLPPRTSTMSTITPVETAPPLPTRPSHDGASSPPTTNRSTASLLIPGKDRSMTDVTDRNLPMRRVSPAIDRDQLANAIVASSLASSRAPSPTKSPASSMPSRSNGATPRSAGPIKRHSHFWPHKESSRPPSPTKGMRQTMRRPAEEEEDDDLAGRKGHRKFLVRKHPNKHHEGDRKRWRDEVTQAERKRYEGVWAANRSRLLNDTVEERDGVHSLIVRDLWNRSRLPSHVLEEIWDLVDERGAGWLNRIEFVVGMWLVDQRLKGRKLPVRVSESVWASVRLAYGIVLGT